MNTAPPDTSPSHDAEGPVPVVRRASLDQVGVSASILDEAAVWAASRGLASWPPGWFVGPDSTGVGRLRADAESGSLYLVWLGGGPVATFSLLTADARFWPGATDDALYLHRFGVRRGAAGVGRRAIAWMAGEARARSRRWIRLDCLSENPGIRRYYEACGFIERGGTVIDGIPFSLYETPVDAVRG